MLWYLGVEPISEGEDGWTARAPACILASACSAFVLAVLGSQIQTHTSFPGLAFPAFLSQASVPLPPPDILLH